MKMSITAEGNRAEGNGIRITREELDRAFDRRFPSWMKEKLNAASVAVAGLGGLGSHVAVALARSGVGHLFLVDFDSVDVTNLNRQALTEMLQQINPWLDIKSRQVLVTEENIRELFGEYAIVCEAFDRPDQKAMLVRGLLTGCPKAAVVSGNGMAGYGDANQIQTVRRMGRLYVCGDQTTDIGEGMGLMAPRVAVCAGHMANQVIRLILGENPNVDKSTAD